MNDKNNDFDAAPTASAPSGELTAAHAKIYRDAIAQVCEGWTLPPGARKALETALWAAPAQPQPVEVKGAPDEDFAKIVRASNGQQVLFFKESTADEGNVLHCVANFPEMQMDMKFGGIPDESFAASLEKVDIAMADKVIKQAADLGLGGAA